KIVPKSGVFEQSAKFEHEVRTIDTSHPVEALEAPQPHKRHPIGRNQHCILMRAKQRGIIIRADDSVHIAKNAVPTLSHAETALNLVARHLHIKQAHRNSGYLKTINSTHALRPSGGRIIA